MSDSFIWYGATLLSGLCVLIGSLIFARSWPVAKSKGEHEGKLTVFVCWLLGLAISPWWTFYAHKENPMPTIVYLPIAVIGIAAMAGLLILGTYGSIRRLIQWLSWTEASAVSKEETKH